MLRPQASSSSGVLCLASTSLLYSPGSLSHSSAACPFNGLELAPRQHNPTHRSPTPLNLLIRLAQQALQAQQHRADIIHRAPLILQNIEADAAREVDVGVVDGRLEQHDRRRVRVVGREVEGQFEGEGGVGCGLGAVDGRGPGRHVFVGGEGGDARGGV